MCSLLHRILGLYTHVPSCLHTKDLATVVVILVVTMEILVVVTVTLVTVILGTPSYLSFDLPLSSVLFLQRCFLLVRSS